MRRNCTWDTDIELFTAALLLKKKIWVFSSDMGDKWMVISGKGAKLIDALASHPVNNAGSIYINNNGFNY